MRDYILRVEFLLQKEMPVLIYGGQNNLLASPPSVMRWMDEVDHPYKAAFDQQSFSKWKVNNKTIGVRKAAGHLELRLAFDAGHYLPMDQPLVAKSMAKEYISGITK